MTTPIPTGAPVNVLVVDDESNIRKTLAICLEAEGHRVTAVGNFQDAVAEASRRTFHLAFVDLRLGTASGLDLIPVLLSGSPWMKIVVITAYASIDTAVEAMRRGATDYIPKPFTPAQVLLAVRKVEEVRTLEQKVAALREDLEGTAPEVRFSSESPAMQRAMEIARQVAPTDAAVLLRGRERHRENRPGPRDPRLEPALHETVRRGVVPLPAGGTAGKRVVRPRERRVHRSGPRQPGTHRRLRGGDAPPRRDRRSPPHPAAQAAAVPAGPGIRAARRPVDAEGRRPRRHGHQPGPGRRGQGRPVSGGSFLSPERHPDRDPAASRTFPRTWRRSRRSCSLSTGGSTTATSPGSRRRRCRR